MTRVVFAIQYVCLLGLLLAYSLAIAEPATLRQLYESAIPGAAGDSAWLAWLEIKSNGFPQAAHSALTAVCLIVAFGSALLRISAGYLDRRVSWDPQDTRTLAEALRSEVLSRALVPLLASYVLTNNWKPFAPVVLASPTKRTASASVAWLEFISSRPALVITAFEILLGCLLLLSVGGSVGERSLGSLRYFSINTIAIFMLASVGFKLLLAAISPIPRYRAEGLHGES